MAIRAVTFSIDDLAAALRAVAAGRPDYVYRRPEGQPFCQYWHNDTGSPGCIFGHALHRLGMDVADFGNGPIIAALRKWFGEDGALEAKYWALEQVQAKQDQGKPWGVAVRMLDDVFPVSR